MLDFEVTHSDDPDFIGIHQYFMNKISFGRSRSNNVIIESLHKLHLEIEIDKEGHLFCTSLAPDAYFLFNEKKISGKKRLMPNDFIKLGDLTFKIPNSSYTQDFKDRDVAKLYLEALDKEPRLKPVFQALEKEILTLSREGSKDD